MTDAQRKRLGLLIGAIVIGGVVGLFVADAICLTVLDRGVDRIVDQEERVKWPPDMDARTKAKLKAEMKETMKENLHRETMLSRIFSGGWFFYLLGGGVGAVAGGAFLIFTFSEGGKTHGDGEAAPPDKIAG